MDLDVISVQPAAAMLGLSGFVVLAAGEVAGELELLVETTARREGCPRCGVIAVPHGRRPHLVRDIPAAGRPVLLVWVKRLWRCAEPGCGQRTWTETSGAVAARAALTERAAGGPVSGSAARSRPWPRWRASWAQAGHSDAGGARLRPAADRRPGQAGGRDRAGGR